MWLYEIHTDGVRDTPTWAQCFTAQKKVIRISELTFSQELKTLPPKTNLPQTYSYATATTSLLEVPTFVRNFIFRNKIFYTFLCVHTLYQLMKGSGSEMCVFLNRWQL